MSRQSDRRVAAAPKRARNHRRGYAGLRPLPDGAPQTGLSSAGPEADASSLPLRCTESQQFPDAPGHGQAEAVQISICGVALQHDLSGVEEFRKKTTRSTVDLHTDKA